MSNTCVHAFRRSSPNEPGETQVRFLHAHVPTIDTVTLVRRAAYTYLSLGCSKASLHKMMTFARRQVGKPFSNYGMAMALLMPRKNDGTSWFCAELVSAILQEGNLMSTDSNPSAATPQSLHKMYSKKAAVTANPYMLRKVTNLTFNTVTPNDVAIASAAQSMQRRKDAGADARVGGTTSTHSAPSFAMASSTATTSMGARRRSASPPKASFRVLQSCHAAQASHAMRDAPPLGLSFESLKTSR